MLTERIELFFSLAYFALVFATTDQAPHQVKVVGLQHQSIELSNYIMFLLPVEEVDWYLRRNGSLSKIVHFENNQSKFYLPELTNRLVLLNNGTTLRIRDLRLKDSGQYSANIILTDKMTQEVNFLLTVYDPAPSPSLTIEYKNKTSDQCNLTVHCSVPANISGLSYSWKYRRRDSDYQLFNSTGDTIHISLQQESWDFLCTVYNPADHKDASMQAMCNAVGAAAYRQHFCILCVIPFLVILSGVFLKLRQKGIQQDVELLDYCTHTFDRNVPATTSSQNFSWREIKNHEIPAPQKFETLYAKLEMK